MDPSANPLLMIHSRPTTTYKGLTKIILQLLFVSDEDNVLHRTVFVKRGDLRIVVIRDCL
jgi:hypothetical protein